MDKLKNSGTIKRATNAFNKDASKDGAVISQQTNVSLSLLYKEL